MGAAAIFGPLVALLILIGNALTPGKGYREGPFSSQAELRELVDLAEADQVIDDDDAAMLHSVFELGDTIVREVMVPRIAPITPHMILNFIAEKVLGLPKSY